MGKGGQGQHDVATKGAESSVDATQSTSPIKTAATSTNAAAQGQLWVSPFTPEKVDPRVSKMSLKEINAQFPTKSEIRAVIPPHCFERSLFWSFYYVFRDITHGAIVVCITHYVIGLSTEPPEGGLFGNPLAWIAWRLAWNVYAVVMTMAMGGLWVIGHECGHGAFSEYPIVNGTMGWLIHSMFLVPYFSWAFSHAKHHRRTNDLMDGETHVPPTWQDVGLVKNEAGDNYERLPKEHVDTKLTFKHGPHHGLSYPLYGHALAHEHNGDEGFAWLMMWSRLFLGFQMYLMGLSSGGHLGNDKKPIERGTFPDHFRPHSRLFPAKMYWKVLASDLGLAIVLGILFYCGIQYGFRAVWFWYSGPYMVAHAFLVTVTWLQHTSPSVPHFDSENWNWIKGSLAGTIDRPFYWWIVYGSHNITDTHVVHHLFHEIPHYHAAEATKHVRAFLEPKGLYNYDPTPFLTALYQLGYNCHFVESLTDGVQYYRSFRGIPFSMETANKKKESNKQQAAEVKKSQ